MCRWAVVVAIVDRNGRHFALRDFVSHRQRSTKCVVQLNWNPLAAKGGVVFRHWLVSQLPVGISVQVIKMMVVQGCIHVDFLFNRWVLSEIS